MKPMPRIFPLPQPPGNLKAPDHHPDSRPPSAAGAPAVNAQPGPLALLPVATGPAPHCHQAECQWVSGIISPRAACQPEGDLGAPVDSDLPLLDCWPVAAPWRAQPLSSLRLRARLGGLLIRGSTLRYSTHHINRHHISRCVCSSRELSSPTQSAKKKRASRRNHA